MDLLEDKIEKLIDIINELTNGKSILSLEVLVPNDLTFEEISSYSKISENITQEEYDKFIVNFSVGTSSVRKIYSLYFQKYDEPYKYGECKSEICSSKYPDGAVSISSPKDNVYRKVKYIVVEKLSDLSTQQLEDLRDERNQEDFWTAWINAIEKNIGVARSTIWSYINLTNFPKENDSYICSAYILFDRVINEKRTLSIVNKYLQDFLIENTILLFSENVKKQSIRAAISQVMARNMSHNIGSHVLSKFKDKEEIEHESHSGKNEQYKFKNFLNNSGDLSGNILIAYFNEYLKNRMDFLADIATTDPVMETPMYLVGDIIKGFDKNRILLNRISGVDSVIKYSIKVLYKQEEITRIKHTKDPLLSIPNEVLGAQAFYILLENIIRNIYKHGNPIKEIELTIDVNEYDKDASFYEIAIYDNIEKKSIEEIIKTRNKAFNDSILIDYMLRFNNLGTIEMDVCAAYLRCLPIISIEDDKYNLEDNYKTEVPKLIYAYVHQISDSKFSLGYKLCISKPKEILVVINDINEFKIKDCNNETELAKEGIKVITNNELKNSKEIYNHQILYSLINSDELNNIIQGKQSMLPKRVVYSNKHISLDTAEVFIEGVWEQYALAHFFKDNIAYCIKNGERVLIINKIANNIQLSKECTLSCFSVFIDNHNENWNESNRYSYYDMACSHSRISKLILSIFQSKKTKTIAEYLEIINTKIIILDERIQQNILIGKRKYSAHGIETPLIEYFKIQKLFIPNEDDCDLNKVSFGTLFKSDFEDNKSTVSKAIYTYINTELTGKGKPDFIVVHLGILEKMLKSGEDKNRPEIDKLINELFKGERKRLVITSGRGKPNNLPDDIPFVQLALVQNAVETLFDKLILTKILFNTRKSI